LNFIVPRAKLMQKGQAVVQAAVEKLASMELSEDEIRRLVENELASRRTPPPSKKKYA
jgi:hypothetical protein